MDDNTDDDDEDDDDDDDDDDGGERCCKCVKRGSAKGVSLFVVNSTSICSWFMETSHHVPTLIITTTDIECLCFILVWFCFVSRIFSIEIMFIVLPLVN